MARKHSKPPKSMEEKLRRMKEDFKRRVSETNAKKQQRSNDEDDDDDEAAAQLIVTVAVRAGLLLLGGISMCFSTLFIPGIVPFFGGLLCGVSLIEPPPLPFDKKRRRPSVANDDDDALGHRNGSDPNGVMKQVVINFIDHFF
jgi:hypothetical protein